MHVYLNKRQDSEKRMMPQLRKLCLVSVYILVNLPSCCSFLAENLAATQITLNHRISFNGDAPDLDEEKDGDDLSLEGFRKAKEQLKEDMTQVEFDGYSLRDVIYEKWGKCYDVDFNAVNSFGFKSLYLNVLPFMLGRRPFRHASELDYLCHLQAVVEILQEYGQLDYILYQIGETKKKPIPGRSPIIAVPLRLDLTEEQVDKILR